VRPGYPFRFTEAYQYRITPGSPTRRIGPYPTQRAASDWNERHFGDAATDNAKLARRGEGQIDDPAT
jgi:hypothetical protein